MKLENQVVSLELSKQLKEAGYKQEGLWIWEPALPIYPKYEPITKSYLYSKDSSWFSCSSVVAPTVAELVYQLLNYPLEADKRYRLFKLCDITANKLAKLWIFRKKEGLIK